MNFQPSYALSRNFKLKEFEKSATATKLQIPNLVRDEATIANMEALCTNVLQPVRDLVGKPFKITSGYRCPTLNRIVGGSTNSDHIRGQAADFYVIGQSVFDTAFTMRCLEALPIHQLILEALWDEGRWKRWIHVSHKRDLHDGKNRNRGEFLTIVRKDGEKLKRTGIHHPDYLMEGVEP